MIKDLHGSGNYYMFCLFFGSSFINVLLQRLRVSDKKGETKKEQSQLLLFNFFFIYLFCYDGQFRLRQ